MRSSVKHAALVCAAVASALVIGAACTGPDSPDELTAITDFAGIASGFNLTHASCLTTPPGANCGTDTSSSATLTLKWGGGTLATASNTFTYTLNVTNYPSSAITSVVLRTGTGVASPLAGTVCTTTSTPACPAAAGSITGTLTPTGTAVIDTVLYRGLRNRTTYARVSTTGETNGNALGNVGPAAQ
jgi:hypothetical protein